MCTVIHSVKKLRVEPMTAKAGSRGHVRWAGRMTSCVMTHDLAMPAERTGRSSTLLLVSWREPAAARAASRLFFFFFFFWRGFPESRKPMRNTALRPTGVIFGFALPLIVTPPNLQNHLALASEGYLNNQCFGSSSRNVAVGGEGARKTQPRYVSLQWTFDQWQVQTHSNLEHSTPCYPNIT